MSKASEKREPIHLEQNVQKERKTISEVCQVPPKFSSTIHAVDIEVARSELGPLNLDYAEADKVMLKQALKLRKRFG